MKILFKLLVISGLLFTTGCQSNAIPTGNVNIPTSTSEVSPSLPSENNEGVDMSDPTINPDPNAERLIQLAKESLAKKFKVNEDQIHLFSIESMVWPDASLGCPQAGMVYAQVLTSGYQILFEAAGQSYSYHTDDVNRVILCQIHPPDNIFPTPE